MKINKQSSVYTVIYIIVLVVIVGAGLAATAMALKSRQQANADADKMRQILAAVHVVPAKDSVLIDFDKYVTAQMIVNSQGQQTGTDAFAIDVATQSKIHDAAKRQLPVYVCNMGAKGVKYVLPVYGAGLWGPIWGYVAVDADGSTIFGAYFAHQSETPGLGAEIEKPHFSDQFDGKQLMRKGRMVPVEVIKKGQKPVDPDADAVDGISGGTITSKGVSAMLNDCLLPYDAFLKKLQKQ